jgi:hypothetical protein
MANNWKETTKPEAIRYRNDNGEGDTIITIVKLSNDLNLIVVEDAYGLDPIVEYLTPQQTKEKYNV